MATGALVILDVFRQAFLVLFYPKEAFKKEQSPQFLGVYVFVLALVPAIVTFIKLALPAVPSGPFNVTARTILIPLARIGLYLLALFLIAFLLRIFARVMAEDAKLSSCMRVTAYALTPVLLSAIFDTIPSDRVQNIIYVFLVIYGCILLLVGIKQVLRPRGTFNFWLAVLAILFFLFFLFLLDGFVLNLIYKA